MNTELAVLQEFRLVSFKIVMPYKLYYLLLCLGLIWCRLLWMWPQDCRHKNGFSENSSVCVHVFRWCRFGCVRVHVSVYVCLYVWAFAWFTLMLYKDTIILLHGSHKLNIFHKATLLSAYFYALLQNYIFEWWEKIHISWKE